MKTLQEFINIINGKSNTCDCVENGPYPFFDRSDVIKQSNKYLFDSEAIIVPGEGTQFVPKYYVGRFDLHQRCYFISSKHHELNNKYLYYFLLYNKDYFKRVATGSTVKSLRLIHFLDMPVNFHNYETQLHIVNTISILLLKSL